MGMFFFLLFLLSLVGLALGLISPRRVPVLRFGDTEGNKNRKQVLGTYLLAALLFLILGTMTTSPPKKPAVALTHAKKTSKQKKIASTTATTTTAEPPTTTTTLPPTTTTTLSLEQIVAQYKASAQHVTVADIAKDPNSYKGTVVTFTAKVVDFVQDSSGNTSAANISDPDDYSSMIQIAFGPLFEVEKVNKGDIVTVWGKGLGSFNGQNGFGATITEGEVGEVYLTDSTSGYVDNSDAIPNATSW